MKSTKGPNWRLVFWGVAVVPLVMAVDGAIKHAWLEVASDLMLCVMFVLHARGKT